MSPPDASDMMTAPSGDAVDAAGTLPRATKAYAHRDDRFALDKKIYGQFFQLYFQRLMLLLPRLKESVARRWPGGPPHVKILDLKEGEECVVMGTLYKDMKLKPSILDEYVKDAGLGSAETSAAKFVSDDDSLVLEDEGARVRLVGPAAKHPIGRARGSTVPRGAGRNDSSCSTGTTFVHVSEQTTLCIAQTRVSRAPLPPPRRYDTVAPHGLARIVRRALYSFRYNRYNTSANASWSPPRFRLGVLPLLWNAFSPRNARLANGATKHRPGTAVARPTTIITVAAALLPAASSAKNIVPPVRFRARSIGSFAWRTTTAPVDATPGLRPCSRREDSDGSAPVRGACTRCQLSGFQ